MMQRSRDPFGEALRAIRGKVRSGRYMGGERLPVADLADELDLSATPVREALARLAGEGLIEERRGQGYFAWRPDGGDLAELYDLQDACIGFALARAGGRLDLEGEPAPHCAEAFFELIVRQGNSGMLLRGNRLLADRLAAPRLAEAHVFDDLDLELQRLWAIRRVEVLQPALAAYHRRRLASSQAIVAALRRILLGDKEI